MISEKSTISWQKWRYTEIKRLIFHMIFFRLQISVANISNLTVKVLPFWNFEAIEKKEKKITVAQQYWGWVVKRPHSWARQGTQCTSSQWKCTVTGNPSAQRNTAFTTLKWLNIKYKALSDISCSLKWLAMTQYSRDGTSENLNVFICFATVSFVLHFKHLWICSRYACKTHFYYSRNSSPAQQRAMYGQCYKIRPESSVMNKGRPVSNG